MVLRVGPLDLLITDEPHTALPGRVIGGDRRDIPGGLRLGCHSDTRKTRRSRLLRCVRRDGGRVWRCRSRRSWASWRVTPPMRGAPQIFPVSRSSMVITTSPRSPPSCAAPPLWVTRSSITSGCARAVPHWSIAATESTRSSSRSGSSRRGGAPRMPTAKHRPRRAEPLLGLWAGRFRCHHELLFVHRGRRRADFLVPSYCWDRSSRSRYTLQICGRALRLASGKRRALIFDHAGNVWRHGRAAPRHWSLDTKK